MRIAIEIGGYGARVALRRSRTIEMVEIGPSESPYLIPAATFLTDDGRIIAGPLTNMTVSTCGETIFLNEMAADDARYVDVHKALFGYVKTKVESVSTEHIDAVTVVIPPGVPDSDPRKAKIREAWHQLIPCNVEFISSDVAVCYNRLNFTEGETALVVDLGFSGLNVSEVCRSSGKIRSAASYYSTDVSLRMLVSRVFDDVEQQCKINYKPELALLQVKYIDELCRKMVESLTHDKNVSVAVPFSTDTYSISRNALHQMLAKPLGEALKDGIATISAAGADFTKVGKVVLAGGGALIPCTAETVEGNIAAAGLTAVHIQKPKLQLEAMMEKCRGALQMMPTGGILNF